MADFESKYNGGICHSCDSRKSYAGSGRIVNCSKMGQSGHHSLKMFPAYLILFIIFRTGYCVESIDVTVKVEPSEIGPNTPVNLTCEYHINTPLIYLNWDGDGAIYTYKINTEGVVKQGYKDRLTVMKEVSNSSHMLQLNSNWCRDIHNYTCLIQSRNEDPNQPHYQERDWKALSARTDLYNITLDDDKTQENTENGPRNVTVTCWAMFLNDSVEVELTDGEQTAVGPAIREDYDLCTHKASAMIKTFVNEKKRVLCDITINGEKIKLERDVYMSNDGVLKLDKSSSGAATSISTITNVFTVICILFHLLYLSS